MTYNPIAALVDAISPRPKAIPHRPARRRLLRRLLDALARANEAYRQRQHLEMMSDRMLKDIGLTRHDVTRRRRW